jgi:23S rRNA pseudouridine1911/1915/1917 synthase
MDLSVLFEDHHYIVVNKPNGLLTQAPEGIDSLESQVKSYIKAKYDKPAGVYLGIPHRLDRPVSGIVLFARNTKAASRIASQFQKHQVKKVYWAICSGHIDPNAGIWSEWLLKVQDEARVQVVPCEEPGAKQGITEYRILNPEPNRICVELSPKTGRTHQLRVTLAHHGLPIWGDSLYGSPREFGPIAESSRDRWIALHALSLTFWHPFRKVEMRVTAEPNQVYWVNFSANLDQSSSLS